MTIKEIHTDVALGQRFAFGKNWQDFLSVLDDERIAQAERSLITMLGVTTLTQKTFVDIGSGSGLFSLAAMRLGAQRVHSFDYDPHSVACAQQLKRRYFRDTATWTIERGSALDTAYLDDLGQWDIVYSWGVLHHTGDMWSALRNVAPLVKEGGLLFISIYNDAGRSSRFWRTIKALYNQSSLTKWLILALFIPYFILRGLAADVLRLRNPLSRYRQYKKRRGMSLTHDLIDWLGGYPFEVAKPENIFQFYHDRGFALERMVTHLGGNGCNEFVFRKLSSGAD